jgi:hypothetical protein
MQNPGFAQATNNDDLIPGLTLKSTEIDYIVWVTTIS